MIHHPKKLDQLAYWIAIFFGAGLFPRAPGTAGSLASLFIWAPLLFLDFALGFKISLILVISLIGIYASNIGIKKFNSPDPKQVVIDEVAGMGIALLFAKPNIVSVLLALLFFRLFDILKPWPINWADKKIKGGMGVMLDDLLAGILSLCLLLIVEQFIF